MAKDPTTPSMAPGAPIPAPAAAPAPPAPAAPIPAPAAAPAPPAPAAPVGQAPSPSALERHIAALEVQNAELRRMNEQLLAGAGGAPRPVDRFNDPLAERPDKKLARKAAEQQAARDEIERKLLDGPQLFDCSVTGEARMDKRVGANSAGEARAKYEDYFGIRAIIDPSKEIKVAPVEAAQAAA